jgi:ribosomal protein L19E
LDIIVKLVETTKKTATRDLRDLVDKEIMEQVGTTGRGTYYVLRKNASKAKHGTEKSKGDLKGTKETRRHKGDKGDMT